MPTVPNQYHLHGDGISVSYYPGGFGPPKDGGGRLRFIYQEDTHQPLSFYDGEVETVDVADLGTVVTVKIAMRIDTGSTTFSLLVPHVQLPEPQNLVSIQTEGITTQHMFLPGIIIPQRETYSVTALSGTAAVGPLPS